MVAVSASVDEAAGSTIHGEKPQEILGNADNAGAEVGPQEWLDTASIGLQQTVLLGMLQATCALLADADIPCWISGGTLLGAKRHRGFIPHDDDVDLECFERDVLRIEAVIADHPHLVFRRGGPWNATPVVHVGLPAANTELDIFLREEPVEEVKGFPSAAEIFPLSTSSFHGLEVPSPGNPDAFLARFYGADWARMVRVWSHDFNFAQGLGHDRNRVVLALPEYERMVVAAGYDADALAASVSETSPAQTIQALLEPGGVVEKLRSLQQQTWLEKLQRKNRDQGLARERMKDLEALARREEGDEDEA